MVYDVSLSLCLVPTADLSRDNNQAAEIFVTDKIMDDSSTGMKIHDWSICKQRRTF
jgi:hypothetical protein